MIDHDHRDVIHYTYDFGRLSEFGLEDFENFNDALSISSGSLLVEVPSEYMFTSEGVARISRPSPLWE